MDTVKIRKREQEEDQNGPFAYHSGWPYLNIGFGDEKDYFIENLSLLITSGLGVTAALSAIKPALKKRRMIRVVDALQDMVTAGVPLWKAFTQTKFFPQRVIAIIKAGEDSGRLPEHLNLVSIQQHKEQIFSSRVRSALLYPAVILCVAIVVGVGSAWYTLPKLTSVLEQSGGQLPVTTQALIWLGNFLSHQGLWIVPLFLIVLCALVYFIFIFQKTKLVGEYIILRLPGINKLLQGVEVARFGFLFGAMLQAGIPVTDALDSVREGTSFITYKKFYEYMKEGVLAGNSFENIFKEYKHSDRLIPLPMQQLIFAGAKSGKLAEILLKIGQIFEEKTESMTKDLATILEPIVLLIVGVIVAVLALAIISPIYSLVNQIQ
jgi:type IV pilus assembly protein PilC